MPDSISGIFSNPNFMKSLQAITGVGGLASNIFQGRKQGQMADQSIQHSKDVAALIANPALMSAKIAALKQPLSQGLVQSVGNTTQAELGERGLGTSPQIATAVESQALAPFEQKSQDQAIQEFLTTLGIAPPTPQFSPVNNSGFWNTFMPKSAPQTSSSGGGSTGPTGTGGVIADPIYGDPGGANA